MLDQQYQVEFLVQDAGRFCNSLCDTCTVVGSLEEVAFMTKKFGAKCTSESKELVLLVCKSFRLQM